MTARTWFVTPDNPARLEAAKQGAADARSNAQAQAAGVGVSLDGLMRLVEPDTTNRPPVIRRVSAAAGSRDMPIGGEEYEVRATITRRSRSIFGDDSTAALSRPCGSKTEGQQSVTVTILTPATHTDRTLMGVR